MSNFTPLVTKQYEFDGDKVVIKFSRMKRKDMIIVLPSAKKLQAATEADDNEAELSAINEIVNVMAGIAEGYIKELNGLTDSEGSAISVASLVEETYFNTLFSKVAVDLLNTGYISSGEVEDEPPGK